MLQIVKKIADRLIKLPYEKRSFSQSGEDCIVGFIFKEILSISKPSYFDIGAFHPYRLSNTAKFYAEGCRGVNIEPNPDHFVHFEIHRKDDINLNIGIGDQEGKALYFMMEHPAFNTFSAAEAKKSPYKVIKEIAIDMQPVQAIINKYFSDRTLDFLSLDVEGMDMEILKGIDWKVLRPKVICVETIELIKVGEWKQNDQVLNFLKDRDYLLYAQTGINSIFIDRQKLKAKHD